MHSVIELLYLTPLLDFVVVKIIYKSIKFIRYPNVCIFSTGDELIECEKDAHYGYIRDTNSTMIKQTIEQDNYMGEIFNYGIVKDK